MEQMPLGDADVFSDDDSESPELTLVPLPQIPHDVTLRVGPGGKTLIRHRCKNEDEAREYYDFAHKMLSELSAYQRIHAGQINFELSVSEEKR
jgi:hypothetical protein